MRARATAITATETMTIIVLCESMPLLQRTIRYTMPAIAATAKRIVMIRKDVFHIPSASPLHPIQTGSTRAAGSHPRTLQHCFAASSAQHRERSRRTSVRPADLRQTSFGRTRRSQDRSQSQYSFFPRKWGK